MNLKPTQGRNKIRQRFELVQILPFRRQFWGCTKLQFCRTPYGQNTFEFALHTLKTYWLLELKYVCICCVHSSFTTDSTICILDFTAICGRQPGPIGLFLYQRKATVQDRMCKIGSPFLVAKLFSRAHLQSLPLNKCISRQVCRHTANIYIVKNTTLYYVLTSKTFLAFRHRHAVQQVLRMFRFTAGLLHLHYALTCHICSVCSLKMCLNI